LFRNWNRFNLTRVPVRAAGLASPPWADLDARALPGTYRALEGLVVLPWNEAYTSEHTDFIAAALGDALAS
jgi:hypothetical protein